MHDDHVGPEELLSAGDLLEDRLTVVNDELQVEVGDAHARRALGGRGLANVATAPPEPEIAALDRVQEHRAVDRLAGHDRECRIALQLREPEVWPKRGHDRADQVREDVLGVVQLDVGEIARIPGHVRDQQRCGLDGREHRDGHYRSGVTGTPPRRGPTRHVTKTLKLDAMGLLDKVGSSYVSQAEGRGFEALLPLQSSL